MHSCGKIGQLNAMGFHWVDLIFLEIATAMLWTGVLRVTQLFTAIKTCTLLVYMNSLLSYQVQCLDHVFDEGAAYNFGRLNSDCWHLYTITPHHRNGVERPDQTFEMIMTDLDPQVMRLFYKDVCIDGKMATKVGGVSFVYLSFQIFPTILWRALIGSKSGINMPICCRDRREHTTMCTAVFICCYV